MACANNDKNSLMGAIYLSGIHSGSSKIDLTTYQVMMVVDTKPQMSHKLIRTD